MACRPICKLCDKIRISQAINVVDGNLVIDLPSGDYVNGCKYCVVISQPIPTTATIGSEVFFSIGGTATQYPLVTRCCKPVTACGIRTRTRYSVVVETSATGANFRMLGYPCCSPSNNLNSVNGTALAATPATAFNVSVSSVDATNTKERKS